MEMTKRKFLIYNKSCEERGEWDGKLGEFLPIMGVPLAPTAGSTL